MEFPRQNTVTAPEAKKATKTRMATTTRRARRASAKKAAATRLAQSTREQRSASNRKGWTSLSPEQHSARAERLAAARRAKTTPQQRSAAGKKAGTAAWNARTEEQRIVFAKKSKERMDNLNAAAERLKAIENDAAAAHSTGPAKQKHGPDRDIAGAKAVARIVEQVMNGDRRSWRRKLDEICEALDGATPRVPCPRAWIARYNFGTWCRAAVSQPTVAIKAIEARLRNARGN